MTIHHISITIYHLGLLSSVISQIKIINNKTSLSREKKKKIHGTVMQMSSMSVSIRAVIQKLYIRREHVSQQLLKGGR